MKNRQYNYKTNKQISKKFLGVWIPKHIYLNDNLSWTEKILITEIKSLEGKKGCYASNEYLAKFLQLSEGTIRNTISKLKKKNYIIDNSSNNNSNNRLLLVNDNVDDYLSELKQDNKELYKTIKISYDIKYQDMIENNNNIDYDKKDKEEEKIITNYEINSIDINHKQKEINHQSNHKNITNPSQKCDPYIYNNIENNNSVYTEKNTDERNEIKEKETEKQNKNYSIKKQIFDSSVPLLLNSKNNKYSEEVIRRIIAKLVKENNNNLELLNKSIKHAYKIKDNDNNPLGSIKKYLSYSIKKKKEEEIKQKENEARVKEKLINHRPNFISSIENKELKEILEINEQNNNWNKVINNLTKLYGISYYYSWFNKIYLLEEKDEGEVIILCESKFIKEYIEREYLKGVINYKTGIYLRKGIYEFYRDIIPNIKKIKLITIEEIQL